MDRIFRQPIWFFFLLEGRIGRLQYWLGAIVPYVAITTITVLVAGTEERAQVAEAVLSLILLWPSIAVVTKRCHDRNRTAWYQLIALIPVIGPLWLLVELGFFKGAEGPNRFGEDPLQPLAEAPAVLPEP